MNQTDQPSPKGLISHIKHRNFTITNIAELYELGGGKSKILVRN